MILFPFHTDAPCEPHYSGHLGSSNQGHEADLLRRSLPQQFIEMLPALKTGQGLIIALSTDSKQHSIKSNYQIKRLGSVQLGANQEVNTCPLFSYTKSIDDLKTDFLSSIFPPKRWAKACRKYWCFLPCFSTSSPRPSIYGFSYISYVCSILPPLVS